MNDLTRGQLAGSAPNESGRLNELRRVIGAERLASSAFARCIAPLLVALDWFGAARVLLERLPSPASPMTLQDVRALLHELGFDTSVTAWRSGQRLSSGSLLIRGEQAFVYLGEYEGRSRWHDGEVVCDDLSPAPGDQVLRTEHAEQQQVADAPQPGWLLKLVLSARREISGVLLVSLAINLLTLVVSLFTMFVYNTIIPSGAMTTLASITLGVVIAVLGGWGLRLARARVMADMTAWAGARIGSLVFRKTLGLPLELSHRVGLDSNLSRLRSLEGVRQWFGGGGAAISFDYPFALIFLLVIALLGGWIVLVPLISLLLFLVLAKPMSLYMGNRAARVGAISRRLGEVSSMLTQRLRGLNGVAASMLWQRRVADLIADMSEANRDYALANALVQTVAQGLSGLTVLATMGVGVSLVLSGEMSTGGLIATMMLIWRVTTPAQQMFTSQSRLKQLMDATRQLENLLLTAGEMANPKAFSPVNELSGELQLDRVYYRYSADREPALNSVSFVVSPGEIVALVGPNGAGKSTLLEMLAGIRLPQNGRILIGGRDIRQYDPADYRAWLGYLPQGINSLPIAVREHLTLRCPEADDSQLQMAMSRVAGPQWWRALGAESAAEAFDLRIEPWGESPLEVQRRLLVRLASVVLNNPPLIVLDDPVSDRDPMLDRYFIALLNALRGQCTIVMATHRPDLIQLADQVAVLQEGSLLHYGPVAVPEEQESGAAVPDGLTDKVHED